MDLWEENGSIYRVKYEGVSGWNSLKMSNHGRLWPSIKCSHLKLLLSFIFTWNNLETLLFQGEGSACDLVGQSLDAQTKGGSIIECAAIQLRRSLNESQSWKELKTEPKFSRSRPLYFFIHLFCCHFFVDFVVRFAGTFTILVGDFPQAANRVVSPLWTQNQFITFLVILITNLRFNWSSVFPYWAMETDYVLQHQDFPFG